MTRLLTIPAALAATLVLAACQPTEPAAPGSVIPTGPYVLVGIGQDTVPQRNVGIQIDGTTLTGQGPCNSYSAAQTGTPPGFRVEGLTTSGQPCSGTAGALESRYFQRLQEADGIKYLGSVLTITGPVDYLTFEPGYRK